MAAIHRFYTPDTGEFLSVDPDVATTHEPYEYAQDDPTNLTDPTGKDCAGGPTTPTAVANFVAAYEAGQFDQYEAGVEFDNAAAFDQYEEGVEFDNAVSAFDARKFAAQCLILICTMIPGVGVGQGTATPIPERSAEPLPKQKSGVSSPAPKGTVANPFGGLLQPPGTPLLNLAGAGAVIGGALWTLASDAATPGNWLGFL